MAKFNNRNFELASFRYNTWCLDLQENETLEDALDPVAWANLCDKVMGFDKVNPKGRGDIIEVRKADTSLFARLLIVEARPGYIKTSLIEKQEPPAATIPDSVPYVTRWNVGKRLHEVLRKADNYVMSVPNGGFQTKESAVDWIAQQVSLTKTAA
jgi:hypothetical protein